jgi:hypothetical protein
MSITRDQLLAMGMNPRSVITYHVDSIVRSVESVAERGYTYYLDGSFPSHMRDMFYNVVDKLLKIFVDSDIYVLENARTRELSLTIDWSLPRKG